MNRQSFIHAILAAGLLLAGGTAFAGEERVDNRVAAKADGTVEIENMAGSITVTGWDRDEVRVQGEIDPHADEFEFESDGDFTTIKVKYPNRRGGWFGNDEQIHGSQLEISVPHGSELDISSISASVTVSDTTGDIEVETISGDIDIDSDSPELRIESISGDIRISRSGDGARIEVETISGSARLTGIKGEVNAGSVSGDVDISRSALTRGEFSNTSGDIEVDAELVDGGRFRFDSISGEIDLKLVNSPNASFDISTFSGDIDNSFGPEPKKVNRYTPNMELKFTAGEGESEISISTMSGDIDLRN